MTGSATQAGIGTGRSVGYGNQYVVVFSDYLFGLLVVPYIDGSKNVGSSLETTLQSTTPEMAV